MTPVETEMVQLIDELNMLVEGIFMSYDIRLKRI